MDLLNERIEKKIGKIVEHEDERYAGLDNLDGDMVRDIIRYSFMDDMRMGYNECSMLTQRSYRAIFKRARVLDRRTKEHKEL